ncbi:hypothetical protein CONCODRAFT_73382 [Conidiobolus coronatus NRRL 28638]|uniref:Uncharacterized protein n=1 Tax=Conidiobolus coronatus (strain ATCC 28846 / CBS 209.66 / NRRL 28638) TaxID=796925 RepID=A0A137NW06_CONC2|nr:hypothetical protein CONCODRAFT_73382 [Conidiobolus coronatus NRRL 28638]|eukprot:KXN66868.1 hypothetical protein CONCODRAFT_73382 [Conidiobolus coronatus NRRL 28638]
MTLIGNLILSIITLNFQVNALDYSFDAYVKDQIYDRMPYPLTRPIFNKINRQIVITPSPVVDNPYMILPTAVSYPSHVLNSPGYVPTVTGGPLSVSDNNDGKEEKKMLKPTNTVIEAVIVTRVSV